MSPKRHSGSAATRSLALFWIFVIGLASLAASSAEAQVVRVWTTTGGHKVGPQEQGPTAEKELRRPSNPESNSSEPRSPDVSLFGMGNETLAFQVVVRAGAKGASDVRVALSGFDFARVRIFREDYVTIAERSQGLVWEPGSAAEPSLAHRELPDRLVPLEAIDVVDIAPNRNQVFWIDLWIAPGAAPGKSRGDFMVTAAQGCPARCRQRVEIELLDRTMPQEMHAKTMAWFSASDLGDERVAARYFSDPKAASPEAKSRLRLRHYQLAREHHISLIGQHAVIDDELDSLLSGRAFTPEMGYRGPGQGRGLDVLALHAYGGELTRAQAEATVARTQTYSDLRDAFVYVMDEPGDEQITEVNRRSRVSRPMPAFVTAAYSPGIDADIFAVSAGSYSAANAAAGAAAGKQVWIYNGERPFSGSFAIDDVAIAPRVNPWIQYKLGIARWFYWEATYYYDFQGKRGAIDVAQNPLNFSNRHGDRVNGDGLLMYPGTDLLFPRSNLGIDGPVPSIRLKNWRRGIEDVEYLVMVREAGFGAEVDALLDKLLPAVLAEVRSGDAVRFAESGKTWLDARRMLFELLRDGESNVEVEPRTPVAGQVSDDGSLSRNSWLLIALAVLAVLGLATRR